MLAKHKRFVLRSIAVGVIATVMVAELYTVSVVRQADARVEALRRGASHAYTWDGNQWRDANGNPFDPFGGHGGLVDSATGEPIDSDVDQAQEDANNCRDNRIFYGILTFIVFAMPLVCIFSWTGSEKSVRQFRAETN